MYLSRKVDAEIYSLLFPFPKVDDSERTPSFSFPEVDDLPRTDFGVGSNFLDAKVSFREALQTALVVSTDTLVLMQISDT